MPEGNCEVCGEPIATVPWNTVTSISYCDNYNCPKFHEPVKNIKSFAEREGISNKLSIKARLDKMRNILFEEEVDD